MLAVGGINEKNIGEYLKAWLDGFGVGSNIINGEYLNNNDFKAITELVKKYTEAIKNG